MGRSGTQFLDTCGSAAGRIEQTVNGVTAAVANASAIVLLRHSLTLVRVSIGIQRGCQQVQQCRHAPGGRKVRAVLRAQHAPIMRGRCEDPERIH